MKLSTKEEQVGHNFGVCVVNLQIISEIKKITRAHD